MAFFTCKTLVRFKLLIKLCIACFFIIASNKSVAQESESVSIMDADYLKMRKNLETAKTDRDSLQASLALTDYFIRTNPVKDSSFYYGDASYTLAKRISDIESMGKSQALLAIAHSSYGFYDLAITEINLSISYFKQLKNDTLQYKSVTTLGSVHIRAGNLDKGLEAFLNAAEFYKSNGYKKKLTAIYNNIGIIYLKLNDIKKATSLFENAIKLCNELGDLALCEHSYQNMATAYGNESNFKKAIEYNNYALDIVTKANDLISVERIYSNMAYTYFLMKDFSNCILYSKKSLEIFNRSADDYNIIEANTFHTLGLAYLEKNDFVKAKKYLTTAREIGVKLNYVANLPEFELGLYTYYERLGDFKKALEYYKEYIKARDQFSSSKIRSNINEIESTYFTLEKEKEIDAIELIRLKEKEKLKSNFAIFVSITGVLVILFLAFLQRQKRVIAENKEQLSRNKYNSLRSQMNPHFIFNTINGVQSQILKANKLDAYNHLNKFAYTIRLMLDNSTSSFIKLEKEIELINNYVDLESARFNKKFTFQIDVAKDLKKLNPIIPSMILQPIIENAIIHGLSNKKDPGHLSVSISLKNNCVVCEVTDNGIGRTEAMKIKNDKAENHLSISTDNTRQRIQLLHKLGYKKSLVTYVDLYDKHNNATGTKVIIILPIKNN